MRFIRSIMIAIGLLSANIATADTKPQILTMGDSFFVSNASAGKAVSHHLSNILQVPVKNRAISGARMIYRLPISGSLGMDIGRQYRKGPWDWIILNGGGNDLWLGCGCHRCENKIQRLISKHGNSGAIPGLVRKLRSTGARVIYVGYLRSPGTWSPIENCKDEGNELESRVAKLADFDDGVWFVSLADMVPPGDRSYHSGDMIHPSQKGSAMAAQRIAKIIAQNH